MLSFLNTTKYPPSLLFLLMTLGPALLAAVGCRSRNAGARCVRCWTIGQVPMFYFVAALLADPRLAVAVCCARYGAVHWMFESPDLAHFPITEPPGWPLGLPLVYLIWIGVVLTMYPLCRWYAGVKARSHAPWLSYL